ncbi:MAG: sulfite exporter TauE/SafE family protein [Phycisphaerae bacterium]|nr:sulfite exporter TauE/SafE family protein [Phycisphaerae bacterium]
MGELFSYVWLIPLGYLVGAYGTLIGAGGGFILVPILLLLYPQESPSIVACISLAVVFFNAASGSVAYARQGRIDYRAAIIFSLAAIPGSAAGAMTTGLVPRRLFDALLGTLMLALAAYLTLNPRSETSTPDSPGRNHAEQPDTDVPPLPQDHRRTYSLGAFLSLCVGYVAALLGIGGGIIHVPILARVLKYPVHTATATSHLILAMMALAGTVVHISNGSFQHGWRRTVALSIGVVLGAQAGAWLSTRIHGRWILRGLAIGLLALGVRLLSLSLGS